MRQQCEAQGTHSWQLSGAQGALEGQGSTSKARSRKRAANTFHLLSGPSSSRKAQCGLMGRAWVWVYLPTFPPSRPVSPDCFFLFHLTQKLESQPLPWEPLGCLPEPDMASPARSSPFLCSWAAPGSSLPGPQKDLLGFSIRSQPQASSPCSFQTRAQLSGKEGRLHRALATFCHFSLPLLS